MRLTQPFCRPCGLPPTGSAQPCLRSHPGPGLPGPCVPAAPGPRLNPAVCTAVCIVCMMPACPCAITHTLNLKAGKTVHVLSPHADGLLFARKQEAFLSCNFSLVSLFAVGPFFQGPLSGSCPPSWTVALPRPTTGQIGGAEMGVFWEGVLPHLSFR